MHLGVPSWWRKGNTRLQYGQALVQQAPDLHGYSDRLLGQADCLPRKLEEYIIASAPLRKRERWLPLALNDKFPADRFEWAPPQDWQEWTPPQLAMLTPGTPAPDFDLPAVDGRRLRLSDLRGSVVWLVFWRMRCPPCRREIPYLQQWHRRCADGGLAILGVNTGDDTDALRRLLRENGITFPIAVPPSAVAWRMTLEVYPSNGVPSNYVIDRDGRVVTAWSGFPEQPPDPCTDPDAPGRKVLANLGITMPSL